MEKAGDIPYRQAFSDLGRIDWFRYLEGEILSRYSEAFDPGLEDWTGTQWTGTSSATSIEWDVAAFACYVELGIRGPVPEDFVKFLREVCTVPIYLGRNEYKD